MSAAHVVELPAAPAAGGDAGPDGLTFIGTATVLLRHGGFTLLTDPNFLHAGDHAYLGMGIRSERLREPALSIAELPPLDAVVLSHHHGDHFDQVAARDLDKDLPIVTEPHAARKLRRQGFRRPVALDTWDSVELRRGSATLRITAAPGRHSPRVLGPVIPPVMGSVLDFAGPDVEPLRMYITGDTLLFDAIGEIARRFPGIDHCVIHLGGTRVAGVLLTMDAEQGVRFLQVVDPHVVVPVHYDDYTVFKSPLADFLAEAERAGLRSRIEVVGRGATLALRPGGR